MNTYFREFVHTALQSPRWKSSNLPSNGVDPSTNRIKSGDSTGWTWLFVSTAVNTIGACGSPLNQNYDVISLDVIYMYKFDISFYSHSK